MQKKQALFNKGPVELKITFTNRCSANCTTCLNNTAPNFYDIEQLLFKDLINSIVKQKQINLTSVCFYST